MVLKVTFEDFAEAVRQYTGGKDAFLAELPSGASATAGSPNSGVIVSAVTELNPAKAKEYLTLAGLKVHEGTWALEADDPIIGGEQAFFCAVAYRSREIMPGLWLDVFPYEPSRADVLRAMYDEFIHNGEMKEVTFDEFVRSSFANVVILSPDIAKGLITKKLADEKF